MVKYILNTAEKIDAIYTILEQGESRRKRANFFRICKWLLILGVMYLFVTQRDMVIGRITETIKPLILSTASGMISTQKAELTNAIKDLLPPGVEIK